jgi:hypothetical protein
MRRTVALLVVLVLATSSLITVESVSAQPVPIPSVPQFTLEPVGPSFDIPPTYTFNASTGMFDTNNGHHIQYSSVKIIIKNQPFSNPSDGNNFFYNVRIRPHDYPDNYWHELFSAGSDGFPIQTLSNYTIIPLPVDGTQVLGVTIPTGATTDIQVEAMIGHIGRNNTYPYPYVFFGETSGWSNTQTITIPANVPMSSASPSPSPTPTVIVSLSESASALDYGVKINFTATANGGIPPYTFDWYVDNRSSGSGSSPYFSIDSMPVGSHHVYVQVNDAKGNSAITNTVEFYVLPTSNLSPSPSIPEFPSWMILPILLLIISLVSAAIKRKSVH